MISVLLAAYCGGPFIGEQITSILPQLQQGDELLVSDDSPEGDFSTRQALSAFQDPRVHLLQGPRRGVIKNFEFLLGQAKGDILVLSDQDDVWLPGKLDCTRKTLQQAVPAVMLHDAFVTDEALQVTQASLFSSISAKPGLLRNLLKNGYTGCCMALRRELLPYILPFPENIPMHDQWIGLCAQRLEARGAGQAIWVKQPYILHRRHSATQTGHGSTLLQKLRWRWNMLRALRGTG